MTDTEAMTNTPVTTTPDGLTFTDPTVAPIAEVQGVGCTYYVTATFDAEVAWDVWCRGAGPIHVPTIWEGRHETFARAMVHLTNAIGEVAEETGEAAPEKVEIVQ